MPAKPLDPNIASVFAGFMILETMHDRIDELAVKRGLSRSAMFREAISFYLASPTSATLPVAETG